MDGPDMGLPTGLVEPISKLIESVRAAIGILYEPTRIIRKARAEGEAGLILARADIAREDLFARAARRLSFVEEQRQENIDSIVQDSVAFLPQTASQDEVNRDWMAAFFENAQDVGDERLRLLWAKLLAGEVAQPGRFSRRCLSVLRQMSPELAGAFRRCLSRVVLYEDWGYSLLCKVERERPRIAPLPDGVDLAELKSLGLLVIEHGAALQVSSGDLLHYYGQHLRVQLLPFVTSANLHAWALGPAGMELRSLDPGEPDSFYTKALRLALRRRLVFLREVRAQ